MTEYNPEQNITAWETTSFSSSVFSHTTQPPNWELCTAAELVEHAPDLYKQLQEPVSQKTTTQDDVVPIAPTIPSEAETPNSAIVEAPVIAGNSLVDTASPKSHSRKGRREKTRYKDMSTPRKIAHNARIGSLITALILPCTADVSTPQLYSPPSLQYADEYATSCPTGTTIGALNMSGVGNNMIGTYSARQEANFLSDQKDICFAGLVYGTDLDNFGNVNVFHNFIEKNNLKRVIIFAFSFGGIATIDMLNEYQKQYPNSGVDIAVVFVSSPAEFDDLQPAQQSATKALSIAPLDTASVKTITYLSIVKNGDKDLLSEKVNHDADVAASNTPPRLLWEEMLRLIIGMSKSDMDIATFAVYDVNDEIINMRQAVESVPKHSGVQYLKIVPMTHSDHLMNNHAAAWWIANNKDYRKPFLTVIDASRKEFERKEYIRNLAQCAVHGRVILRLAC